MSCIYLHHYKCFLIVFVSEYVAMYAIM